MAQSALGPPSIDRFRIEIGKAFLHLNGWKAEGPYPSFSKSVVLFAPHTTNWDFPFVISTAYALGINPNWMGKREMFWGPAGPLFRWMGGIPIDRRLRLNTVEQTVQAIRERPQVIIGIAPEGTRSKTEHWKSGFYHIAHQAQVPLVFAWLDYKRKVGGFGPHMHTTGDMQADIQQMRDFFCKITPKYPEKVGEIRFRPAEAETRG